MNDEASAGAVTELGLVSISGHSQTHAYRHVQAHAGASTVAGCAAAGAVATARQVYPSCRGNQPAISADGEILTVGRRVQTQWTADFAGDGSWFAGSVLTLHTDGHATIIYDDGQEWKARLDQIYVMQGEGEEQAHEELPPAMLPVPTSDRSR